MKIQVKNRHLFDINRDVKFLTPLVEWAKYKFRPRIRSDVRMSILMVTAIPIMLGSYIGFRRERDYLGELEYSMIVRGELLDCYYQKHHRYPTNLDDIEREFEANQYPEYKDPWAATANVSKLYREYRPKMTIIRMDSTSCEVLVRYTRGYCRLESHIAVVAVQDDSLKK